MWLVAQPLQFIQYSWREWILSYSIFYFCTPGSLLDHSTIESDYSLHSCRFSASLKEDSSQQNVPTMLKLQWYNNIRTFHPSWQGTKLTMVTGGAIGAARRTGIVAARQAMTWANLLTPRLEPGSAMPSAQPWYSIIFICICIVIMYTSIIMDIMKWKGNGQSKFLRLPHIKNKYRGWIWILLNSCEAFPTRIKQLSRSTSRNGTAKRLSKVIGQRSNGLMCRNYPKFTNTEHGRFQCPMFLDDAPWCDMTLL